MGRNSLASIFRAQNLQGILFQDTLILLIVNGDFTVIGQRKPDFAVGKNRALGETVISAWAEGRLQRPVFRKRWVLSGANTDGVRAPGLDVDSFIAVSVD